MNKMLQFESENKPVRKMNKKKLIFVIVAIIILIIVVIMAILYSSYKIFRSVFI